MSLLLTLSEECMFPVFLILHLCVYLPPKFLGVTVSSFYNLLGLIRNHFTIAWFAAAATRCNSLGLQLILQRTSRTPPLNFRAMAHWLCTACSTPNKPTINSSQFLVCPETSCQRKASLFGASVHTNKSMQTEIKRIAKRTADPQTPERREMRIKVAKRNKRVHDDITYYFARKITFDIDELAELFMEDGLI